jgi:hypothetical protein
MLGAYIRTIDIESWGLLIRAAFRRRSRLWAARAGSRPPPRFSALLFGARIDGVVRTSAHSAPPAASRQPARPPHAIGVIVVGAL